MAGPTHPEAEQIAREVAAVNDEIIALAESLDDGQWNAVVPGEEWSVGVVVHHVARGHLQMVEWLGRARRGQAITKTAAEIDDDNARHAVAFAAVSRPEAVEELRRNGAELTETLRSLDADELARTAAFGPAGGRAMTTLQLASVSPRHPGGHLAAIRNALG
jgi:uncharacterized damage-inducible protein DinB